MKQVKKTDFKLETLKEIEKYSVNEYYLIYTDYGYFNGFEFDVREDVYQGYGEINWDEIPVEQLEYDPNSGEEIWRGWISFTDGTWIERDLSTTFDIVDGEFEDGEFECWEHRRYPKLNSNTKHRN